MPRLLLSVVLLAAMITPLVTVPMGQGPFATTSTRSSYALTIGPAVVKPKIDGMWQAREWDDASEVELGYYTRVNNLGSAYLRLKYDNASLYLLYDVLSDNGNTLPPGHEQFVLASFDTNNDGWSTDEPAKDFILTFQVNGTGLTLRWYPGRPLSSVTNQTVAAQHVGASPHSTARHRTYEASIPTSPLLSSAPPANPNTIGFNACAIDVYGNVLCLLIPGPVQAELTFGTVVVPENLDFLLPLLATLAFLSFVNRLRKRNPNFRTATDPV